MTQEFTKPDVSSLLDDLKNGDLIERQSYPNSYNTSGRSPRSDSSVADHTEMKKIKQVMTDIEAGKVVTPPVDTQAENKVEDPSETESSTESSKPTVEIEPTINNKKSRRARYNPDVPLKVEFKDPDSVDNPLAFAFMEFLNKLGEQGVTLNDLLDIQEGRYGVSRQRTRSRIAHLVNKGEAGYRIFTQIAEGFGYRIQLQARFDKDLITQEFKKPEQTITIKDQSLLDLATSNVKTDSISDDSVINLFK